MVTFQFVPYPEIEDLSSAKKINKLLNIVKQNKIVLLEGRLKKEEEADLIEITMEEISNTFKGIELTVIDPERDRYAGIRRLKAGFVNMLLGNRQGFTIIGPASVVKRIKRNPNAIELYTNEVRKRKKK